jgi:hypothetical protein
MTVIDWQTIFCPVCGEKRKNTKKNKVWFDPRLSEKQKGKMTFYCTNHNPRIHFVMQEFIVDDDTVSVSAYVFQDRKPKS